MVRWRTIFSAIKVFGKITKKPNLINVNKPVGRLGQKYVARFFAYRLNETFGDLFQHRVLSVRWSIV